MRFNKSAVVGVFITLYLSTDSWCHYIPEKKTTTITKKNGTSSHLEQIQICGNALTTLIIEACDGIVGSFSQANPTRESVQTKITEDCCDQECPLDYLQNYCGETPLFTINTPAPLSQWRSLILTDLLPCNGSAAPFRSTLRGKLLGKLARNRSSGLGANEKAFVEGKKKGISEVRIREKKHGRRKWEKNRKKRKRSFKLKCAYKSFGHYLLKLDRGRRVRNSMAKGQNRINRTWPSIQIGTISPEIDKFGGQPIVVVKKNKSNTI